MTENMPQNPQTQDDLLENLLKGAAEHAAKTEMEQLAKKGTVTKEEFGAALSQFERNLLEKFDAVLGDKLQKALPSTTEEESEESEQGKPVRVPFLPAFCTGLPCSLSSDSSSVVDVRALWSLSSRSSSTFSSMFLLTRESAYR